MPNTSVFPFSDLPLLYCTNDYNQGSFHKHMPTRYFFPYNRLAEAVGMVGTCPDKLIQPLYSKQVNYNRLLRSMSSHTLNVSTDTQRDCMAFLGNLCHCVTTLQEQKSIFSYSDKTMSFHLCPLTLFLSLGTSFFITSHQTFLYTDNVHSELSPDLIVPVLSAFSHVRSSPLSSLLPFTALSPAIHLFLVMQYPELNTTSQIPLCQDCEKEKDHLSRPANTTLASAVEEDVCCLCNLLKGSPS